VGAARGRRLLWHAFPALQPTLARGARRDACSQDGRASLHLAAYQGHLELVKLLLSKGANVTATTAVRAQWTSRVRTHHAADIARARRIPPAARPRAARHRLWPQAICAPIAPPHARDARAHSPRSLLAPQEDWTALHAAADKGHLEVVKLLLSSGASPGAKGKARAAGGSAVRSRGACR
jgi:ankyrin repeat protein